MFLKPKSLEKTKQFYNDSTRQAEGNLLGPAKRFNARNSKKIVYKFSHQWFQATWTKIMKY